MRDISARELKGHNILAVERFQDNTRWMIEFSVRCSCSFGSPGDEMRLFLTEDGYQAALVTQKHRESKIKRYTHGLGFKPDKTSCFQYKHGRQLSCSHAIIQTKSAKVVHPMKIERLIGILSILRQRETELAEQFKVSCRTIQRFTGFPDVNSVLSWVLTFGNKAELLEPEELREQLGALTQTLADRYRRN